MKLLPVHLSLMIILVGSSCTKSLINLSGTIRCMEDPSGVALSMEGPETHSTTSSDDGSFTFNDLEGDIYELVAEKEMSDGSFVRYTQMIELEGGINQGNGGQFLQEIWIDDPLLLSAPSYFNDGSDKAYLVWQQPDCSAWGQFEVLIGNQPELTRENATEVIWQWRNDFEIAVPSTPIYVRVYSSSDNGRFLYGTNTVRISKQDIP